MMESGLDFFATHGGQRTLTYPPQPELDPATETEEQLDEDVALDYELSPSQWRPLTPHLPAGFAPRSWPERPRRFIDGRDVGEIIATLWSKEGFPIPVRLSQIGAVAVTEVDGHLRRTEELVQRTVTLIGDPFPWQEIEGLAAALQARGLRLLLGRLPNLDDPRMRCDFEVLRKMTNNRSNHEMAALEESFIPTTEPIPTVLDRYLDKWFGATDPRAPVIGVIKSHMKNHLSTETMKVLYHLQPGERTPLFLFKKGKFPVVSFYLRLAGGMPSWGLIRVELSEIYYQGALRLDPLYLDKLAFTLFEYRCRQESYGRAPVSLEPIVRAEQTLGALLCPMSRLIHNFYRITNL